MSNIKIAFASLAGLAAMSAAFGLHAALAVVNPINALVAYAVACL